MNYTMTGKRILTDGYADGYRQGVQDALADPEEARAYAQDIDHQIAWEREQGEEEETE